MQAPPTVHMMSPAPAQTYNRYNMKLCFGLGVTQLVFGCVCFVLEILLLSLFYMHSGFQGVWAGIVIIVTGALGTAAGRMNGEPKCMYVATATMSIFASIFAFIGMCVSFSVAWTNYWVFNYEDWVEGMAALGNIQGILFLAEFIISIVHCVVCFRPVCCYSTPMTTTTTIITTAPGQPMGYVNAGMYPPQQAVQPVQHVQHVPPGYGYSQPMAPTGQAHAPPPYPGPNNKI